MKKILITSVSGLALCLTACGDDNNSTGGVVDAATNVAPVVSAGADQSVQEREQVQLSGSATDADGDTLTFSWSQVSGSMVDFSDASIANPVFRAPNTQDGEDVVLRLTVSDGTNSPVSSDVTISIADTPRDGASPQGINDGNRRDRRDDADNRTGNRPMVGGVEVRTYDGSANNLTNTNWGAAFEHLQRLAPNDYADGISEIAGPDRVSARVVSNLVHNQDDGESVPNTFGASDFVWQWGQFIDHDIDLTDGAEESADIIVPAGDVSFDPAGTGAVVIPFNRALFDPSTGTDVDNPREQENEITSWIDGSMVYGSDDERAEALRDTTNRHLLATSDGNLLPFNTAGLTNANPGTDILFLAGDVRANEQASLTVMHTLFVREHNRMAEILMDNNPDADPDDVFETARRLLVGKIQYITYNEWLPALIGEDAIPAYSGYDDSINPNIYNEFSVAAFRLGHTLLNENFIRLDADGNEADGGPLPLAEAFFAGTTLFTEEDDMDSILRGLASQLHQKYDVKAVTDIRNFLFGPPGAGGLDLPSLNIQRGRDHGAPSYNALRTALGLTPRTAFSEISSDADVVAGLEAAYDSVDDIDLWTGGLAEDAVSGSQLGELFQTVMVRQFTELRDADRFWYEIYLPQADQNIVENTSLAEIIRDNTSIGNEISDDVFSVQ
ncbi:MAG: peroxidase family protein [Litorimonas sp.]